MAPSSAFLLTMAGLPGTGKTTLGRVLAARLGAVFLRIDSIEAALARSTLRIRPAEDAGYVVACALAADNLRLGRAVIADSVDPIALTRDAWADVARTADVPHVVVELVCTDLREHRRRIEARRPDIEGQRVPTWQDVTARHYEPFTRERLVVDTARLTPDGALDRVLQHLRAAQLFAAG